MLSGESLLRSFHSSIVSRVEPADVVDHLYQHQLIDEDDMERVLLPSFTRRERCRALLIIISRRVLLNPQALHVFLEALEGSYDYLCHEIRAGLSSIDCKTALYKTYNNTDDYNEWMLQQSYLYGWDPGKVTFETLVKSSCLKLDSETLKNKVAISCECDITSKTVASEQVATSCQCDITSKTVASERVATSHECDIASKTVASEQVATSCQCDITSKTVATERVATSRECDITCKTVASERVAISHGSDIKCKAVANGEYLDIGDSQDSINADEDSVLYSRLLVEHCTPAPRLLPPSNFGKWGRQASYQRFFDDMSSLVNQGQFLRFDREIRCVEPLMLSDVNIACIMLYLDACRGLIQMRFSHCKRALSCALQLAPRTSQPARVMVELLSVHCWLYLKRSSRAHKLENTLLEAMNLIQQDPLACTGMAAGWIYVDEAKRLVPLMRACRAGSRVKQAESLRERGMASLRVAMQHFQRERSQDGPYGFNYASIKLASLMLGCDDELNLIDLYKPSEQDLSEAESLLSRVDDCESGVEQILRPLYLIASSDLKYRTGRGVRAGQLALEALQCVTTLGLTEEVKYARIRCERYGPRDLLSPTSGGSPGGFTLTAGDESSCWESRAESDSELCKGTITRTKTKRKRKTVLQTRTILNERVLRFSVLLMAALVWSMLTCIWPHCFMVL